MSSRRPFARQIGLRYIESSIYRHIETVDAVFNANGVQQFVV